MNIRGVYLENVMRIIRFLSTNTYLYTDCFAFRTFSRQFTPTPSNPVYSGASVSLFSRTAIENVTTTRDILMAGHS